MNKDLELLDRALNTLASGFADFPSTDSVKDEQEMDEILQVVATAMHDNYPYFSVRYAGQMLKPPHVIARLAYMLALYINPNNHALDGSRASSPMEKECIQLLGTMFGWDEVLGHLTSGGTVANLEALWVASRCHPGKLIVASEQAHYTHERISEVLNISFRSIRTDHQGRMDMQNLEELLNKEEVGTVVVTLGTTGSGALDRLEKVIDLKKTYGFRIHIDAAYGGYFILSDELTPYARSQFDHIHLADSIVIDPHKHGLQPYGCGCILFKDIEVGKFYRHDSPYTYFTSDDLHLGEISIECSRAGASAVALWATMKYFPLERDGRFSNLLNGCRRAAMDLFRRLAESKNMLALFEPELDIVVWAFRDNSIEEINNKSRRFFTFSAKQGVHLALIKYSSHILPDSWSGVDRNEDQVVCLRTCFMKPEHEQFIDDLWGVINDFLLKP